MILTAENLGKRFNREWIFRNFNYSFEPGVYAITGPNGSGKSTLLQTLWGQLPSTTGLIQYKIDQRIIPVEDIYSHLVIVAPYMDLIEEFTVEEVVKFHFCFKKVRNGLSQPEVIAALELERASDKAVGQLSSGMKQRLKLGLAFFSDVNLIFLDEPTTNLDKKSIEWYWRYLTPLLDKCTIFVASNLEDEYPVDAKKVNLPDYK